MRLKNKPLCREDGIHLLRSVLTVLSCLQIQPPELDSFGRVVEQPIDTWEPRSGVALALTQIAPLLTPMAVVDLISFFVSTGLGDRSPDVRNHMLAAALASVDLHGKVSCIPKPQSCLLAFVF